MVDLDSETLFNAAAAIVVTVAVVIFVNSVSFPYSPVSKVALVLLFLAGVFAITQTTDDHQLTLLGYGVMVVAVVALFFDLVGTFGADDTITVLGLLVIAAVLFSARRWLDERNHFVSGERAKAALAVVAVLAVGVLLVDVATGGLVYELQVQQSVEFESGSVEPERQVQVASLVVSNPTPFPEQVDRPQYAACAAGNWSAYRPEGDPDEPPREVRMDVNVRVRWDEHVFGFSQQSYPVTLHLNAANIRGESFPVELTEACPDEETGSPYIAIFRRSVDRRYGYAD